MTLLSPIYTFYLSHPSKFRGSNGLPVTVSRCAFGLSPSKQWGILRQLVIQPYSEPSLNQSSCFPSPNKKRHFFHWLLYYESLLLVLPSHNQLHQLHFPTVPQQFSSMWLPAAETFSSSLIFTTSSITPLPGFWTPNYDSSNLQKYDFINISTNHQTYTFPSAFDLHSYYSPCQEYTCLSRQVRQCIQDSAKVTLV